MKFRRLGNMFNRWQQEFGSLKPSLLHDPNIFERLRSLDKSFAIKYASAWAIAASELPNYSGAVGEIRDFITLTLGKLAPDSKVTAEANFKYETGQKRPTRRQKARFVSRKRMLSGDALTFDFSFSIRVTLYDVGVSLLHLNRLPASEIISELPYFFILS